jgi:hypothetical protein
MDAIKKAQEFIATERAHPDAAVLATLIQALQDEGSFNLGALYGLAIDQFELALQLLDDWRLQRYYMGGMPTEAGAPVH